MEITFEKIGSFLKSYGIYILILLLVFGIGFGGYSYCGRDQLEDAKEEYTEKKTDFLDKEKVSNEAWNKLKEARANKTGKVEVYEKDYQEKAKATDQAKKETDVALEKVEVIKESRETGVTIEEAERNRCKAFPESCKKTQ